MQPSSGSPVEPNTSALISALRTFGAAPPQHHAQNPHHHHYHAFLQDQQQRQVAFQALRPITTQLLVLRDQPDRLQPQLLELRRLLETLPASGVASCWEYVAFPLLILLDSVVPARRRERQGPGGGSGGTGGAAGPGDSAARPGGGGGGADAEGSVAEGDVVAPACRSDRVLEALLGALQVLLERSPGPGPAPGGQHEPGRGQGQDPMQPPPADTQLAALQRLAPLLQLPRDSASEEVHLALQRCLQAALRPLAAAAEAWAAVADAAAGRDGAVGRGSGAHVLPVREERVGGAGGRVGSAGGGVGGGAGVGAPVFCSEEAASLAGYLVHCCLEVAEGEVLLGHRGSKSLCAAALTSLDLLVVAMPDPDTLAFFLPGIVSGLSKHLFAAGAAAAISGPSAPPGAAATVQALVCLRTAIVTVLSDEATSAILGDLPFVCGGGGPGGDAVGDGGSGPALPAANIHKAEDALSALKALSVASSLAAAAGGAGTAAAPGTITALTPADAAVQQQQKQQERQQQRRRLRVDRTLCWLEETSARINSLLARALPPLASHPRPAVRAALASTCVALLDRCGRSLTPSQPLLLRLLFTLAQDEWQQVAAPCRDWVARRAAELEHTKAAAAAVPGSEAADSASRAALGEEDGRQWGGGEGGGAGAGAHSGAVLDSARGSGGGQRTEELRALEDEFERFMQGLMSDSALLEPPALELDEQELYGGTNDAAGGRDQDQDPAAVVVVAAPSAAVTGAAATQVTAAPLPVATAATAVHDGTAERRGSPPPPPSPLKPATPPALPGLQHLIAATATSGHLLRAVRAGEAEALVQARCLTTALLVAGSGRAAEWLLLRPAALSDLLAGLFRCFAFDRNAAPLILHLSGEAGAYAPAVTTSVTPSAPTAGLSPGAQLQPQTVSQPRASSASAWQAQAQAQAAKPPLPGTLGPAGAGTAGPGDAPSAARAAASAAVSAAAAAELPRMPVGLLYLASQRSYAAVAAVARTLGRLARAADLQAAAASGTLPDAAAGSGSGTGSSLASGFCASPRSSSGSSGVLRRLMDELTGALRAAERRKPPLQLDSGDSGSVGGGRAAADQEEAEEQVGCSPSVAGVADKSSWQCEAAAVVAVLAEVVIGASNAWVPPLEQPAAAAAPREVAGQPPAEEPTCGGAVSTATAAFPPADPAYEAVLLSVLQELMRPAVLKLSTHNSAADGATAASGGGAAPLSYDDVVHPELAAAAARRPLSSQALGENVMLLREVLEAVGTAARAAGPRFASQGRLLRTVLVPLLELLGDPQPSVAASADAALRSICAHCGYGGSLTALLGTNADYVVDAMCARLRDLQRHPRAPHLLAALLRRAGVAPQLLPLMAEPLQRALQGLSVLARHWAPHYAHSYLAALRELAAGAAGEAEAAAAGSRAAVAELNRLAAEARDCEERRNAMVAAAASDKEAPAAGGTSAAAAAAAAVGPGGHEEVRRYFIGRAAAGARQGAGEGGAEDTESGGGGAEDAAREDGPGSGDSGHDRPLLTLAAGQLEEGELRFRRLHAAAVVAGAAADAATPLLLSSDLRAAIAASEVLRGALAALAASTPAVEAEAAVVEEYGGPEARMRPVRPETPKVLPAVASAWGPLMAALRDARTPVVERGVAAVAQLVAVAGGTFLARRFQQEAWPVLQRLLASGTAHTPGLLSLGTDAVRAAAAAATPSRGGRLLAAQGGGGAAEGALRGGGDAGGALAPAAVTRVRVAVLGCLEAVCRCRDATAAVRTLTWNIAQAALPFLGSSHPPQLHEAAQAALLAVAALDPDGVWLLLYDTSYNMPPSLPAPAARVPGPGQQAAPRRSEPRGQPPQPQQQRQGHQQEQPVTGPGSVVVDRNLPPPGPSFPPLRVLLPPLPGSGAGSSTSKRGGLASSAAGSGQQWAVTAGMAADCGPRAQALLGVVAGCPAPWHATPVPQVPLDVA